MECCSPVSFGDRPLPPGLKNIRLERRAGEEKERKGTIASWTCGVIFELVAPKGHQLLARRLIVPKGLALLGLFFCDIDRSLLVKLRVGL